MTDIQDWLDEGKALADKTIPGPWVSEWVDDDNWYEIHGQPFDGMVCPQVATIEGGGETEAAFIADARTRLPQALDALQAVLDLHKRIWLDGREYCTHCVDWGGEYPCPTVLAIHDALGENDE